MTIIFQINSQWQTVHFWIISLESNNDIMQGWKKLYANKFITSMGISTMNPGLTSKIARIAVYIYLYITQKNGRNKRDKPLPVKYKINLIYTFG